MGAVGANGDALLTSRLRGPTIPSRSWEQPRAQVASLAAETRQVVDRFFKALDRGLLSARSPVNADFTLADALLHQIRHISYHVGHCDAILRGLRLPAARWRGFGE